MTAGGRTKLAIALGIVAGFAVLVALGFAFGLIQRQDGPLIFLLIALVAAVLTALVAGRRKR